MGGAPSGDRKPDEKAVAMVRNVGGLPSKNSGGRLPTNCFEVILIDPWNLLHRDDKGTVLVILGFWHSLLCGICTTYRAQSLTLASLDFRESMRSSLLCFGEIKEHFVNESFLCCFLRTIWIP